MKPKILIANPSSDGQVSNLGAQLRLYGFGHVEAMHCEARSSIVTYAFNQLWTTALNARVTYGITHFLLWHADVKPKGDNWIDVMISEMEADQADVLSAIIPIKDGRGLTSTAFDMGDWKQVRLTQKEIWSDRFPDTWTADNLLFNTGLMLVDFRKPWVEKVYFTINDQIVKNAEGLWVARVESEDWNFSRQCRELGVRGFVTRKVALEHRGVASFHSDEIWGDEKDHESGVKDSRIEVVEG